MTWIATGFGIGHLPMAPGTFGTLAGVLIYLPLSSLSPPLYVLTAAAWTAISVASAQAEEDRLGRKDPSCIVIDEIAGFLWAMALIPPGLLTIAAGFCLFRVFDILKVFPGNWVERRLPGGWGITLDDVVAGIYTGIVLHLLRIADFL